MILNKATILLISLYFLSFSSNQWCMHSEKKRKLPESTEQTSKKPKIASDQEVVFNTFAGKIPSEFMLLAQMLKKRKKLQEKNIGIPRMIYLHGQSGTGKTILIKELAEIPKKPLVIEDGQWLVDKKEHKKKVVQNFDVWEHLHDHFEIIKNASPSQETIFLLYNAHIIMKKSIPSYVKSALKNHYQNIIFIAESTEKAESLNAFDKVISLSLPATTNRKEILGHYTKQKNVSTSAHLDFSILAEKTDNLTGQDLERIVNDAAARATLSGKELSFDHFIQSIEAYQSSRDIPTKQSMNSIYT